MTTRKNLFLILFNLGICFAGKCDSKLDEKLLKSAWKDFTNAVIANNFEKLKSLSTSCIKCTFCLRNSKIEESIMDKLQLANNELWYEKLYGKESFISIDEFLLNDFNIIFNQRIKSKMRLKSKLAYNVDNNHNSKVYNNKCIYQDKNLDKLHFFEVLVTYQNSSKQFEGCQWAYSFVELNGEIKFCGFSTIP